MEYVPGEQAKPRSKVVMKPITLTVPASLHRRIVAEATARRISVNQLCVEKVAAWYRP